MKQIEIKNISIGATFTFFGGIGVVTGIFLGLFGEQIFQKNFLEFMAKLPVLGQSAAGIMGSLIFGVILGALWGFSTALTVALYNVFATLLGGIKVIIEEKE